MFEILFNSLLDIAIQSTSGHPERSEGSVYITNLQWYETFRLLIIDNRTVWLSSNGYKSLTLPVSGKCLANVHSIAGFTTGDLLHFFVYLLNIK